MNDATILDPTAAERLDLHAGALRVALRADLGGSIAGLWHRDVPVLQSTEPSRLEDARVAACFPMLPFANRIGHAHFRFKGRDRVLRPNVTGDPHPMHGVGWQRRWTIESHTGQDAVLRLEHAPDADWPYRFEAIEHLNLAPDSLGIQLLLTNTGDEPQPAGLGWWLRFPKRSRSRLHADVGERWDTDVNHLPIRRHSQPGIDGDLAHLDFDHAFEGWSGPARIRDERFSLQLRAGTRYLVLSSQPQADHFAIAPCTHLPNAINMADPLAHGITVLQPGEQLEFAMSIDIAVL
jgi:aldose 1-epimerase